MHRSTADCCIAADVHCVSLIPLHAHWYHAFPVHPLNVLIPIQARIHQGTVTVDNHNSLPKLFFRIFPILSVLCSIMDFITSILIPPNNCRSIPYTSNPKRSILPLHTWDQPVQGSAKQGQAKNFPMKNAGIWHLMLKRRLYTRQTRWCTPLIQWYSQTSSWHCSQTQMHCHFLFLVKSQMSPVV